jgi:hypothetical protein
MKKYDHFETEILSVISRKAKWTTNDLPFWPHGAFLGRVLTK